MIGTPFDAIAEAEGMTQVALERNAGAACFDDPGSRQFFTSF
jgi:hypothetical protein